MAMAGTDDIATALDHPDPGDEPPSPSFDELLRSHGHRVTTPRRLVWDELTATDQHLTADDLARRLRPHRVNQASIYRTLNLLRDLGLVRESRLGDNDISFWEPDHPDEHMHLVCEDCGRVDHHVGSLVKRITDHLADHHRFQATSVDVVVKGRCADCR